MLAVCSHRGTQSETAQAIELLHGMVGNMFITRYYSGDAWIDRLRSVAATEFLNNDIFGDYMIFIDDDIVFLPEHIMFIFEDMIDKGYDLIGGLYPTRSGTQLASYGTGEMGGVHIDGSIQEMKWLATGFMGFSRKLLKEMVEKLELPILHKGQWCENYPFFVFRTHTTETGTQMLLSEDWDFCEKAKECGHKVYADTRCMLGHKGDRVYTLTDVINHNRSLDIKATKMHGILTPDKADKALRAAVGCLEDFGARPWIDSGTLLSTVRDGDFNRYDHDIDVRVFKDSISDDNMPDLVAALYESGFKTIQQNRGERKQILALYENEVMLDLKFVERNDKWVWYYVWDKMPGSSILEDSDVVAHVFPRKFFEQFSWKKLKNNRYFVPNPVEEYLTYHYGDSWRDFKAKPENVDETDFTWDAQHTPPCSKTLDELKEITARREIGAPSG